MAAVQTFILLYVITFYATTASAQLPPIPSPTDGQLTQSPTITPSPPTNIPPPTIEITSVQEGQQVPVGELTIGGISSDDEKSNCWVYADVNDMTPMRNVSGIGLGDLSRWSFSYTEEYELIKEGSNELTAKISCFAPSSPTPLSEWHTINVTGIAGRTLSTQTVGENEEQVEDEMGGESNGDDSDVGEDDGTDD